MELELVTEKGMLAGVETAGWLTVGLWCGIWRMGERTEGGVTIGMLGMLGGPGVERCGVVKASSRRGVSGSLVMVAGAEVIVWLTDGMGSRIV